MRILKLKRYVPVKVVLFCLALMLTHQALSQSFIEGTHYSIVESSKPPSKNKETVEYFSFSCPGCFAMEAHIGPLKAALPSLTLRRVHLPFGGRNAKLSQKAFVLIELLNANQHHQDVFNRIHLQNKAFNDEPELIAFFQTLGYDELEITKALNSFSADTLVRKMNNEAINYKVRTVPTIIVNGKYRVDVNAVFSGTDLTALIKYLNRLP